MSEPDPAPSLQWERAVRAEFRRHVNDGRSADAMATAEILLRDAYPRQLDLFREYADLCRQNDRIQQGIEVLWRAAEAIERHTPWYGVQAWLTIARLIPADVRPLQRIARVADPLGMTRRLVETELRAAYARLLAANLIENAQQLQADVDFPLTREQAETGHPSPSKATGADVRTSAGAEPPVSTASATVVPYGNAPAEKGAASPTEDPSEATEAEPQPASVAVSACCSATVDANTCPPAVADQRFRTAASSETWQTIARELADAGESAASTYATARAVHAERQPGYLSGPRLGDLAGGPPARVLLFPGTEVGTVHLRRWQNHDSWFDCPKVSASGQVLLPAGWEARFAFNDYFFGGKPELAAAILGRFGPDDVQALSLVDQEVEDEDLALLRALTGLRELSIAGADLACSGALDDLSVFLGVRLSELSDQVLGYGPTDDGLRHVAELSQLRELDISVVAMGDRGLTHLERLEHLEVLEVNGTALTDRGLHTLARCRPLRAINLSRTKVTPHGLLALAGLPALDGLDLYGVDLRSAPDRLFGAFPALRYLRVSATSIPIAALAGCERLERLDLSRHGLATEDILLGLVELPNLRTLFLADMRENAEAAVAALRRTSGDRIRIIRNREDGFLGRGGSWFSNAPADDLPAPSGWWS